MTVQPRFAVARAPAGRGFEVRQPTSITHHNQIARTGAHGRRESVETPAIREELSTGLDLTAGALVSTLAAVKERVASSRQLISFTESTESFRLLPASPAGVRGGPA